MRKKMRVMSGNASGASQSPFASLFQCQQAFQEKVTGLQTPVDSPQWFSYHMQAMQEELGEVLKADKRWKTHRNAHYDPANKYEELADIFITWMNLVLFSGFSAEEMHFAIALKLKENESKLEKGCPNGDSSC